MNNKIEKKVNKILNVTNHKLNADQIKELKEEWYIEEVLEMPEELKAIWRQIPAEANVMEVKQHIDPIVDFIIKNKVTHIVLAGDFTAVSVFIYYNIMFEDFPMILFATSKRESVEVINPDGSVTKKAVFKHVKFRQSYGDI